LISLHHQYKVWDYEDLHCRHMRKRGWIESMMSIIWIAEWGVFNSLFHVPNCTSLLAIATLVAILLLLYPEWWEETGKLIFLLPKPAAIWLRRCEHCPNCPWWNMFSQYLSTLSTLWSLWIGYKIVFPFSEKDSSQYAPTSQLFLKA
jgi:hypothetical protein